MSDLPPGATDVAIGHKFVNGIPADGAAEDVSVTAGELIKTVVAFSNDGRLPYHVWGVMASLNNDKRFDIYVQNFSYSVVNKTVEAGNELSFSYAFTPNARLDISTFRLAITMFYEAQSSTGNAIRGHSSTFYNTTVITKPGTETMSNGMFMLFFFVGIAAAAGAWFAWKNMETATTKEAVEMGTSDSSKNEWLEEHHNMARTGGGRAKLRGNSSKN